MSNIFSCYCCSYSPDQNSRAELSFKVGGRVTHRPVAVQLPPSLVQCYTYFLQCTARTKCPSEEESLVLSMVICKRSDCPPFISLCFTKNTKKVSEYVQEMTRSHTTNQPMAPRGRDKERQQRHDIQNTTKVKRPGPDVIKLFHAQLN